LIDKEQIQAAFKKAKEWIKENILTFAPFIDEPELEIVETNDGWDIRPFVSQRKIRVNLKRILWHLERENIIKHRPKYDIETALIHDLFEYCYFRRWNYPENDPAVVSIVHDRARAIENALRRKRGLTDWI